MDADVNTIILDLGGVLINLDYEKTNRRFTELGLEDVYSKAKQIELFDLLEEGKIEPQEFYDKFNLMAGTNHEHKVLKAAWNSILLDFPLQRLQLVQALTKKYDVYLFSNTNAIHVEEVYNILNKSHGIPNLDNYFKKVYLSNTLGLRKPKKEAFEAIIQEQNLEPNKTLFIDDSPQHLVGAKSAGLQTEWLDLGKEDIHELADRIGLL